MEDVRKEEDDDYVALEKFTKRINQLVYFARMLEQDDETKAIFFTWAVLGTQRVSVHFRGLQTSHHTNILLIHRTTPYVSSERTKLSPGKLTRKITMDSGNHYVIRRICVNPWKSLLLTIIFSSQTFLVCSSKANGNESQPQSNTTQRSRK